MAILCLALRNCQTVFHTGCPIAHFHQQCMKIIISPYPHKHLLFLVLHYFVFDSSHPTRCKNGISSWFRYAFSYWLLMLSVFTCACRSFAYLLRKNVLCPLFNWVFCLFIVCCKSSLYIPSPRPLSDKWFAHIFLHSVGCIFTFLVVHGYTKFLILMKSTLFIYFSLFLASGVISKKPLLNPRFGEMCPCSL